MRSLNPTILIILIPLLLGVPGCALLELKEGQDVEDSYLHDNYVDSFESSAAARQHYAEKEEPMDRIQSAVEHQDLVLGMDMSDVKSAWGEPRDVETAGSASQGNQRWVYINGLSGSESRQLASSRAVYFERGKVVGWENGGR